MKKKTHPFSLSLGWLLVIAYVTFEILHTKWRHCIINADCESYIAMVSHWGFTPDILPHHAMRILPSVLVWVLTQLGMDMHQGFWFLSCTSFILFGLGLYKWIYEEFPNSNFIWVFVLFILSGHWMLSYGLSHFYQATDAMAYPMGLYMLWHLKRKNSNPILISGLLGCAVRQSLFVLAFFALLQLAYEKRSRQVLLKAVFLFLGYSGLTHYYGASGALIMHLIPDEAFWSPSHWLHVWEASEATWLLMPVIPMFMLYPLSFERFYARYPALLAYGAFIFIQPFFAFDMTGQANFIRIAMQGIWPLYLCSVLVVAENAKTRIMQVGWLLYMGVCISTFSNATRGIAALLTVTLFLLLMDRQNNAKHTS